jgi:hypothetical protein
MAGLPGYFLDSRTSSSTVMARFVARENRKAENGRRAIAQAPMNWNGNGGRTGGGGGGMGPTRSLTGGGAGATGAGGGATKSFQKKQTLPRERLFLMSYR